MAEIRIDIVTGRRVLLAEERAARPLELAAAPQRAVIDECPFCEGREHLTPPEAFALRPAGSPPDGPGWRVRVVANKYPAVTTGSPPGDADSPGGGPAAAQGSQVEHLWARCAALGSHEVVVESPRHVGSVTELSDREMTDVCEAYRRRMADYAADRRVAYVQVFKNVGAEGGASIEHLHSQIVALPFVPAAVEEELAGVRRWRERHGGCVFCAMLEAELAAGERIVAATEHLVALCPFASRFPWETWILPRRHAPRYDRVNAAVLAELGPLVRKIVACWQSQVAEVAYNYFIHTAPFDTQGGGDYHWHLELFPRVAKIAGFEWGTGCFINIVAPERAAARLAAG